MIGNEYDVIFGSNEKVAKRLGNLSPNDSVNGTQSQDENNLEDGIQKEIPFQRRNNFVQQDQEDPQDNQFEDDDDVDVARDGEIIKNLQDL